MADKLAVWKQALVHLGSATITTLADAVPAVNVFNTAWPGVVEGAFSDGDWNFAKKTIEMSASVLGTASPGYSFVYDYPDDYQRTIAVAPSSRFDAPFNSYIDEGGYLHSNVSPLFLRFISSTNASDANVTRWPVSFWRYVAVSLAFETSERITQSSGLRDRLEKRLAVTLSKAKSVDAMNEQGKAISDGSWLRSRGSDRGIGVPSVIPGGVVLTEGDI